MVPNRITSVSSLDRPKGFTCETFRFIIISLRNLEIAAQSAFIHIISISIHN